MAIKEMGFKSYSRMSLFQYLLEWILVMPENISVVLLGIWAGTAADFTAALQKEPLETKPDPFKAW